MERRIAAAAWPFPPSATCTYSANTKAGWVVVVDGTEKSAHGGIVRGGRILFESPDSPHFLSVSGQEVYLMTPSIR